MSDKHILSRTQIAENIRFVIELNCPHCQNAMPVAGDKGSMPTNDLHCLHGHCNLNFAMDEPMRMEFDIMLEKIRKVLKKYREKIIR